MGHMHHCGHYMAPQWVITSLFVVFLSLALLRLVRLLLPNISQSIYGFYDWENEVGHGLCNISMAACLTTGMLGLSSGNWAALLAVGTVWYLARALSWNHRNWFLPKLLNWEYKLGHSQRPWEWAHVGMLGFMIPMYYPLGLGTWFTAVCAVWWVYFSWRNTEAMYHTCKEQDFKLLKLVADFEHALMGAIMFVMTVWPMALMPMVH